jgi:hypothetical protein
MHNYSQLSVIANLVMTTNIHWMHATPRIMQKRSAHAAHIQKRTDSMMTEGVQKL